jgi:hypothetical protein
MGCGDWNDGMNLVGKEGRGESVWLAWFLLDDLSSVCRPGARAQRRQDFAELCSAQAAAARNIEAQAWDGDWYRRAWFDDGTPLGSASNDECQIDSISQSWAVISGGGDPERARQAMAAVDQRLVRRDSRSSSCSIRPSTHPILEPGYIKGYIPGVRENGGQYTHAAIWTTMAFAMLGDTERAWEFFALLNPGPARQHAGGDRTLQGRALRHVRGHLWRGAAHRPRRLDLVHRRGRLDVPADRGNPARPAPRSRPPAHRAVHPGRLGQLQGPLPLSRHRLSHHIPAYPRLVAVPGYPVYYAPQIRANYFFYDGLYWVYRGDNWYASSWYNGPWWRVEPYAVPVYILRVPVRYYRQPPAYFRGWRPDAPPRWSSHWGREWEQKRRGWDTWDRRATPPPAPLPAYQRLYSGDRYPSQIEQQHSLQQQRYPYQPRDPLVRQHTQERDQACSLCHASSTAQAPHARSHSKGAAKTVSGQAQPRHKRAARRTGRTGSRHPVRRSVMRNSTTETPPADKIGITSRKKSRRAIAVINTPGTSAASPGCRRSRTAEGRPQFTLNQGINMNMTLSLTPLISLIAGILILVMPRLLNFIVAIYLIVIGLIGLFGGR